MERELPDELQARAVELIEMIHDGSDRLLAGLEGICE
jgi:hypothetical protein